MSEQKSLQEFHEYANKSEIFSVVDKLILSIFTYFQ